MIVRRGNVYIKNREDLLKIYGVDYKKIKGYSTLDDLHKHTYKRFIVNFFDICDIETKKAIELEGIYFVEEIEYIVKQESKRNILIIVGGIIKTIDIKGKNQVLKEWIDDEYKDLKISETSVKNYLRFEYKVKGVFHWLQVINENTWY